MNEREIFLAALDITEPEARAAFLQKTCGRNVTLRCQVEDLLKEHFSNDSLLAGPALEGRESETLESAPADSPAQVLGRYKLLEKIGEGGFGEVWMVEQREPVKRRIALKILKLGMGSRQIVARLEAERQALATMDHANIARTFDADVTDTGRPYFVMELVRGIKITEYCDQNQLTTRERLQYRPQPGEEDLRSWEWRYLWQLTRSGALATLTNRPVRGFSVSFSPDGTRLAVGWLGGRVDLWEVPSRRWLRRLADLSQGPPESFLVHGPNACLKFGNLYFP